MVRGLTWTTYSPASSGTSRLTLLRQKLVLTELAIGSFCPFLNMTKSNCQVFDPVIHLKKRMSSCWRTMTAGLEEGSENVTVGYP